MICENCKKESLVRKIEIAGEAFFLCKDCKWTEEDIKIADKVGNLLSSILGLKNDR